MTAPVPPAARPAPRRTRDLLLDRTFGPWFWGNLASNSGNWLYNVTAAVVVFSLTGSALLVGLVSVAQFGTLALLSPWAGALSDRFDRRRLLVASQSLATLSAAGIAVPALVLGVDGLPGVWPIIVATIGIGIGVAFAGPALQSLVPALVDDADLENAVALTALTFNVGRALGPATAGLLLVTLGAEAAFAINAASFLVLIAALLWIRPRGRITDAAADHSVRAGLRYVRADRVTLGLLVGVGAVGFASDPINTLAPALAEALGGGDGLVAALVSAFGAAAAVVALGAGRLQRARGVLVVATAGSATMAVGGTVVALAPVAAVALVGFGLMGAGFVLGLTSFTSVLQRRVPDGLRGRVMALWTVAFLGNRPVAAVIDGSVADLAGPRAAMVVPIAVALGGAAVAVWLRRAGDGPVVEGGASSGSLPAS